VTSHARGGPPAPCECRRGRLLLPRGRRRVHDCVSDGAATRRRHHDVTRAARYRASGHRGRRSLSCSSRRLASGERFGDYRETERLVCLLFGSALTDVPVDPRPQRRRCTTRSRRPARELGQRPAAAVRCVGSADRAALLAHRSDVSSLDVSRLSLAQKSVQLIHRLGRPSAVSEEEPVLPLDSPYPNCCAVSEVYIGDARRPIRFN
jgi:hypothetical protein